MLEQYTFQNEQGEFLVELWPNGEMTMKHRSRSSDTWSHAEYPVREVHYDHVSGESNVIHDKFVYNS